ncbi:MAG TPA: hypothetical protein VLC54_21370 [Anaeromyxobacter sp.]|nr:hypothetical protein [Anaeromyxobacter sp.]
MIPLFVGLLCMGGSSVLAQMPWWLWAGLGVSFASSVYALLTET